MDSRQQKDDREQGILVDKMIQKGCPSVSRSLVLCIFIGLSILLCVLFRQCYVAMPWDEATLGGIRLAWLRKPLAVAFLVVGMWGVCLAAGALFWWAVSQVAGARWSQPVRGIWTRLAMSGTGAWLGMLCAMCCLLPVLFPWSEVGRDVLRADWISGDSPARRVMLEAAGHVRLADLSWFLNVPFFIGRQVGYFLLMLGLARLWHREEECSLSLKAERRLRTAAAVSLPLLVVVIGLMGVDWVLMLQPDWIPSMGPLYMVAYAGVVGLAASLLFVRKSAWAPSGMNAEGSGRSAGNAMGALLLASLLFKAYFAYSLYMLVWYTQIPEEQAWMAPRLASGWETWGMWAMGGGVLVPALWLMLPGVRRSSWTCRFAAVLVVVFSLMEACWLIAPVEGMVATDGVFMGLVGIVAVMTLVLMTLAALIRRERRRQ